jgi:hypothetical protein
VPQFDLHRAERCPSQNRSVGAPLLTIADYFPILLPLPPHGAAPDGSGGVGGARFARPGGDPRPKPATPRRRFRLLLRAESLPEQGRREPGRISEARAGSRDPRGGRSLSPQAANRKGGRGPERSGSDQPSIFRGPNGAAAFRTSHAPRRRRRRGRRCGAQKVNGEHSRPPTVYCPATARRIRKKRDKFLAILHERRLYCGGSGVFSAKSRFLLLPSLCGRRLFE